MERNIEMLVFNKVTTYSATDPFRKFVPVLPVLLIPLVSLDLYDLMGLILVNGKHGTSYFGRQNFRDIVTVPTEAYLMLDVDNGSEHLNTPASLSEDRIRTKGRSPHTILEGALHVLVFPEKFTAHNINLCGSRGKDETIPHILLHDRNGPRLGRHFTDYPSPVWGTPSCAIRATQKDLFLR